MELFVLHQPREFESLKYTGYSSLRLEKDRRSKEINREAVNNSSNDFCQHKNRHKVYLSPLWWRDSTKRLQRKPIRKSTSYESALDVINDQEPLMPIENVSVFNSTVFCSPNETDSDLTPRWQKVEYNCLRRPRKDFPPISNPTIFNSTMKNSSHIINAINTNTDSLLVREEGKLSETNHTRKLKISNCCWINWTPFWCRDDSKRLERRHYISDFLRTSDSETDVTDDEN